MPAGDTGCSFVVFRYEFGIDPLAPVRQTQIEPIIDQEYVQGSSARPADDRR
jgi:hypothetical protein